MNRSLDLIRSKRPVNQWFGTLHMNTSRSTDAFLAVPCLACAVLSVIFLGFRFASLLFWLCAVLSLLLSLSGLRSEQRVPRICAGISLLLLIALLIFAFVP